jgi:Arc/MetJ-type ribon-helix-helix transcriptional regulator
MSGKTHTPNLETTTTAQNMIPPPPIETENNTASENLSSLPVSTQEEKTPVIVPNNTDSDQIILSNNSFKRFIELKFDPNQANQNPERISFGFERFVIPKLYTVQPTQEVKPADISSEIKIETPPSTDVPEQAITVDKPINETSNSLARFVPLELTLPTGTIDLQPTVTNITETENQAKISNLSFHTESFERFKIPDFTNTAAIIPNATPEIKVTDQKVAQATVIETDPAVTITQSDQTTTEKVTVKPEVSPFIRVQHKSRTVEIVLPPELQDWISAQAQSTQNMPTQSSLVRESVLTDEDNESDLLRIKEIQAAAEERTRISHAFDIPSPTAKTSGLAEVEKQIQIAPILPLILDDDEKSEDKLEQEQTVETVTDQNLTVIEGTAVNFDLIEEKFDAEILPHSLTVESLAEEEIPRTGIQLSKIIEPNITPIIDTQAISSNLENLLKAREKKEEEVQAIEPVIEEDHVHPIFIPINKPRRNPNLMRQALTNLKEIKSPSAAIKAIQQRFIDSIFNTPLQTGILSSNPVPADDEFVAEYPQVSTNVDELIEKIRIAEPQIAANRNAITNQSTQQSQSVVDNNINEELNNPEADVVISETLAKLYQQQGKIARAIEVYEQLKLLFPEKISYFEAQIASLKLL